MPRRSLSLLGGLLVALLLLAGLTWLGSELLRPIPPTPTNTPLPVPTAVGGANGLIAFTSTRDGNPEIYVMNADGSDQRNLTQHPAWDSEPAWSPDGRRLAFVSDRATRFQAFVLELETRAVTQVTDFSSLTVSELNWSPDSQTLTLARPRGAAADHPHTGLYQVKADGSGGAWLFPNDEGALDDAPLWSADGRYLAFQRSGPSAFGLHVLELATGTVLAVGQRDRTLRAWSPDGRQLLYQSQRALRLFDPASRQTRTLRELNRVETVAALAWSPDGTRIVMQLQRGAEWNGQLHLMWSDGSAMTPLPTGDPEATDSRLLYFDWSPDSRWIVYQHYTLAPLPTQGVFTQTASLNNLYALNIENAFRDPASLQPLQLTFTGDNYDPRWQPSERAP